VIIESGTRAADEHAEAWDQVLVGAAQHLQSKADWQKHGKRALVRSEVRHCSMRASPTFAWPSRAVPALPTW
jgi:hypothetical protein